MQVNNNNKLETQPVVQNEEKRNFNSALQRFKDLERGKAPQQIKKAAPVAKAPVVTAAVVSVAKPLIKIVVQDLPLMDKQYHIEKEKLFVHIQNDYSYLSKVDPKFQNDEDLVKAAKSNALARIKEVDPQNHLYLQHYPKQLQEDKELVLAVVGQSARTLKGALDKFQEDPEVILAAKKMAMECIPNIKSGYHANLSKFPLQLQKDKEVVLAAVRHQAYALQNALEQFISDKDVVVEAYKNNPVALDYIAPEVWGNKEVVLALVQVDGKLLQKASLEIQNDKEVAITAFKQNDLARRYFGPEIWKNREAVLELVKMDGWLIEKAEAFQNDREVVLAAVKQNGKAIEFASKEMKKDKSVLAECYYE